MRCDELVVCVGDAKLSIDVKEVMIRPIPERGKKPRGSLIFNFC